MRNKLLLLTFFTSSLFANMGAVLIVPRDAAVVIGLYSGLSAISTDITIDSTDPALDGRSYRFRNTDPFIGGLIGVQNAYYRLSLSYDINDYSDIKLQRYLLGFDFKIGTQNAFRPMAGFGVGVAESRYKAGGKSIDQSSGLLVFRGGMEYRIDKDNTLEFLLEYSHMLDSGGSNYYDGADFTSYKIEEQHAIMFRAGYNFEY